MADVAAVTDLDLLGVLTGAELPHFDRPDSRTRAARWFGFAFVIDGPAVPIDWETIYAELRLYFTDSEIVELGQAAALALGGMQSPRSIDGQKSMSGQPMGTEERWT